MTAAGFAAIVAVTSASPLTWAWAQFQASPSACRADMACTSITGSGFGGMPGTVYSPSLSAISATNGRSRSPSPRPG